MEGAAPDLLHIGDMNPSKPLTPGENADKIPAPPANKTKPFTASPADSPKESAAQPAPASPAAQKAAAKPSRDDVHEQRQKDQPREGVVEKR